MTYPTLEQPPRKIGAAAHYTFEDSDAGLDIPKLFTRKDKYGEEFVMYERDLTSATYMVPRNCAPLISMAVSKYGVGLACTTGARYNWTDGFVPRDDEQLRMVEESTQLFKEGDHCSGHIMRARTGYGKTYLGSAVIQRVGLRALIITTKEDIVEDWKTALGKTLNIDPDKIGEWHGDVVPEPHHEVVVGLIQSVCKGYERYPKELYESFGMVVVDEVQRMGAEKFTQAMWYLPARFRLGLSATPFRKDGRDELFHAHIGEIDVWTDDEELIPKVICVDTGWKVPTVWNWQTRKEGPLIIPWDRAIIAVKYLQEDYIRNQIICSFMKSALKKGRSTVIMSDTVDHLQFIKDALVESGIEDTEELFGWYCGLKSHVYKGMKNKMEVREKAKLAKICLATYKMTSEGTNVPWWDTIILATSKADVEQPVGRIRRLWDGKCQPVVLDLCDYNHRVFATFAKKRMKWYESIGAEVVYKYFDKLLNLR
jgi:superfamily II DNA or RNA helicase